MKKIVLITISLLVAVLLSACSCTPVSSLKFNHKWFSEDQNAAPQYGYREVCTYSVELVKDFNEDGLNFSTNSKITDDLLKYSYDNGTLKTELEVLSTTESEVQNVATDFLTSDVPHVIKYTSTFTIDSHFQLKDEAQKDYSDKIESIVYFCPEAASYTPIYSKTTYKYQDVRIGKENIVITTLEGETVVSYSKNSYTINGSKQNREFKTYVDNAQLLFALRNIDLEPDKTFELPTVSAQYKVPKTLSVMRMTDRAIKLNISGIGEVEPNTQRLNFRISSTNAAGQAQLVYLNNAKDLCNGKSIVLRYVEPLIDSGSYYCLGAMQYTLTNYFAN